MLTASDIADWWDEQHRTSKKALDEFVDEHPNWFGVVVAGTVATAMDLGGGMVDVLRLGQGAAEGSLGGVARDGLRLLQLAPAIGKIGRYALARFMVDPGGGICTWVSAAKALRQVGAKTFASVDDLAKAAGLKSIQQLGGAFVDELLPVLRKLGARATLVNNPTLQSVIAAAARGKEVVLFSLSWAGGSVGHTIYAFRSVAGRVVFADRTGKIVNSIAELERFYPGISKATVYGPAALLEGPRLLVIDGVGVLAMEVLAQLAVDPVTVAQTFEVKKLAATPATAATASGKHHVVRPGDSLSKLARAHYGDLHKWPVLYEANRRTIGPNPDLILPGQKLWIPTLPAVTAARP